MVTVVGLGFVGLTTALGFAEYGHKVYGIEADPITVTNHSIWETTVSGTWIRRSFDPAPGQELCPYN